uniref:Trafficking protein particle complex subunit 13 C-terminal domain-containing protein n=1 Tax=Cacopsylla melanoneura TaxID=428564 RepID=A0A8D9A3G5_9HEMI
MEIFSILFKGIFSILLFKVIFPILFKGIFFIFILLIPLLNYSYIDIFIIYFCTSSLKPMELSLFLENLSNMSWIGVSGRKFGTLESKSEIILPLCLVPLVTGLQVC